MSGSITFTQAVRLGDWDLVKISDLGAVAGNCELEDCGEPIRFVYVCERRGTGEQVRVGSTHGPALTGVSEEEWEASIYGFQNLLQILPALRAATGHAERYDHSVRHVLRPCLDRLTSGERFERGEKRRIQAEIVAYQKEVMRSDFHYYEGFRELVELMPDNEFVKSVYAKTVAVGRRGTDKQREAIGRLLRQNEKRIEQRFRDKGYLLTQPFLVLVPKA